MRLKSAKTLRTSAEHSANQDITIDDEIREKLYQLENENLEFQKQLNSKAITSESFLNEPGYENNIPQKKACDGQ